jgi:arginine utilization regulatory protein
MGRVANTIHSVYPLQKNKRLCGTICIIREYTILENTIRELSAQKIKKGKHHETRFTFDSIIGEAPEFINAVNTGKMAANTPSPIMLYGETGTGKELFAQAIHNLSDRCRLNYTPVNCAAIPENLLEGILFGTSKGAFTGSTNKRGLFEQTNGGTIFLDELNSMAIGLQAKILRVLQERKVRRLGSLREIDLDLKIISSVNQEPHLSIAQKRLRSDLFYRLGVVFIPIPPLRKRPGDIERLANHFLEKHRNQLKKPITGISKEVLDMFHSYHWPGNVRELEHVIEGAIIFVPPGQVIGLSHLQSHLPIWHRLQCQDSTPDRFFGNAPKEKDEESFRLPDVSEPISESGDTDSGPLRNFFESQTDREKELIDATLSRFKGNVTESAKCLGISRQLLHYKMKKHGLNRAAYTLFNTISLKRTKGRYTSAY